ncbi:MAG: DsbA family protein [Candidatus Micrarchaeota archaeon]
MEGEGASGAVVSHSAQSTAGDTGARVLAITLMAATLILAGVIFYSVNSLNTRLESLEKATLSAKFVAVAQPSAETAQPTQPTQPQPTQPTQPAAADVPTFDLAGKTARGDASAQITIVEYSDFQCPFCGRSVPTVEKILEDYDGKVKLYFKHFPLGFHQYAQKAAEASECAGDQGKFWEYHDKLFANQQALTTTDLKKYATDLGLDAAKFNTCLDTGAKASVVQADFAEGSANGVGGTPTFFINGKEVVGAQPYDAFKTVIDGELGTAA